MSEMILALLDDLFLVPRIEDVARSIGLRFKHIASPADLGIHDEPRVRQIQLTEPLDGPEAILVETLSKLQPALFVVDASVSSMPWEHWVQVLKTSAATRRIPIIVFGPHVREAQLNRARSLGVEAVLTRGSFSNRMAEILEKYSRRIPIEALASSCDSQLSDKARQGIELHNRGAYHDAHEWLEEAWMEVGDPEGYLYRALLQFTIIHLHLSRDNLRGARKMLLRVHQWLDPLPPHCREVDVATLKSNVESLRETLTSESAKSKLRPFQIELVS